MSVSRETAPISDLSSRIERALGQERIEALDSQIELLTQFARRILEQNDILNLISQREPTEEVVKQIADSAAPLRLISLRHGCRILDIGSGAGFPGVAMKILRPGVELISLDASPGKIAFQRELAQALRIEFSAVGSDFKRFEPEREFDVAVAKAFSKKRELLRKLKRWLVPGGIGLFLEGREIDENLQSDKRTQRSFHPPTILPYKLQSHSSDRHLVIFSKKR